MTVFSLRWDDDLEAQLAELARPGETRSATIRRALVDAAALARRERLRAEAFECANDADDLAESRAILVDMERLRA